jgi:hypothetical protein
MTESDQQRKVPAQPQLGPEDDNWHDHSQHWWETETTWFTFNVPERNMCGGLYIKARSVQQTCDGGAWIWDDSPSPALYDVQPVGLPFPDRGGDLRDLTAPNGVSVKMLQPLTKYHTTYSDPGSFEADLIHEASHPAHSHPVGAWPYWNSMHLDQHMHTTGYIVIHGERIPVDCYGIRDRTWGPRPEGPTPPDKRLERGAARSNPRPERANHPYSIAYMYGAQDAREAFLVSTSPFVDENGEASDQMDPGAGFLLSDGVYSPLAEARRETILHPDRKWVQRVHIEGVDYLGRTLSADGELLSRWGEQDGGGAGFFHWTWNDSCEGWGEDESGGPPEWMDALDGKTFERRF